jgi:hypothetical protein
MGWAPIMARITLPLLSSVWRPRRRTTLPWRGAGGRSRLRPREQAAAAAAMGAELQGINLTKSEVVVPEALAAAISAVWGERAREDEGCPEQQHSRHIRPDVRAFVRRHFLRVLPIPQQNLLCQRGGCAARNYKHSLGEFWRESRVRASLVKWPFGAAVERRSSISKSLRRISQDMPSSPTSRITCCCRGESWASGRSSSSNLRRGAACHQFRQIREGASQSETGPGGDKARLPVRSKPGLGSAQLVKVRVVLAVAVQVGSKPIPS